MIVSIVVGNGRTLLYRAINAWNKLKRDGWLAQGHGEQLMAMFVAVVLRNALESFHADHIDDELMPELNALVGIYTALRAAGSVVTPSVQWLDCLPSSRICCRTGNGP